MKCNTQLPTPSSDGGRNGLEDVDASDPLTLSRETCSCGKDFANKNTLRRHKKKTCKDNADRRQVEFVCFMPQCAGTFSRKDGLKQHLKEVHRADDQREAMEMLEKIYSNGGVRMDEMDQDLLQLLCRNGTEWISRLQDLGFL